MSLKKFGAYAEFDYKASDVVSQIIDAVKKDGVTLRTANCVVDGVLQLVLDVLGVTKVAHTPDLLPGAPTFEGVEINFFCLP